jgi:hypothetical protein
MEQFLVMGRIVTDRMRPQDPTLKMIEACRPFVFDHEGFDQYAVQSKLEAEDLNSPIVAKTRKPLLCVPFPVFSLEVPTQFDEKGVPKYHSLLIGTQVFFDAQMEEYPNNDDIPPDLLDELCYFGVSCLLVDTQRSAQLPDFYALHKRLNQSFRGGYEDISWAINRCTPQWGDESEEEAYWNLMEVTNKLLAMTEVEQTLKRPSKKSAIKYRNPNNRKKKLKITKPVVYVVGKCFKQVPGDGSRPVVWTHQWRSRGHWRKMTGIGKNADGSYCERNRTWVIDSIKGPEDKALVEKQHVVKKVT